MTTTKYTIEYTGLYNETWTDGVHYSSREYAREIVRFLNTQERKLDTGLRATYKYAKVVPVEG